MASPVVREEARIHMPSLLDTLDIRNPPDFWNTCQFSLSWYFYFFLILNSERIYTSLKSRSLMMTRDLKLLAVGIGRKLLIIPREQWSSANKSAFLVKDHCTEGCVQLWLMDNFVNLSI
jgi:hypothetical protein